MSGFKASIYSVAKAAGTSVGTVSNVINHPERVRPELRKRVEAVMAEQSFRPHPAARALSKGRSRLLGTIVFDIANPFFSEMAHSLDQLVQVSGNNLTLAGTDQNAAAEERALASFRRAGADGYAVCSTGMCFDTLAEIQAHGNPVLLYAQRSEDPRIEAVTIDDRAGMALIAQHLIDRGVRRFAFLDEPVNAVQHRDRWEGFSLTLEANGLDVDKVQRVQAIGPTWAAGYEAAAEVLASPKSQWPESFVCLNDYTAMGVCKALRVGGLQVGRDIYVTGYDDTPYADVMNPTLTTIHQPIAEMSDHLAEQLLRAVDAHDIAVKGKIFKPELVVRASA